jgi:hypothetical protein
MSTVAAHERCVCAASALFLSSLAWEFLWSLGAGSSLLCACVFWLIKCTVEVARGTGRHKKRTETGVSRLWGTLEPWLLQPLWFLWWRDWSLQIYFPASRVHCLADHGYRLSLVPFLTLTATIMELKVWTGFFWHRLAQGHRCALAQIRFNIERSGVRSGLCGVCCCLS